MQVSLEDNKVIIDDKVEVTPIDGNGYKFKYPGQFGNFVTIAEPLGSEIDTSRIKKQSNGAYSYDKLSVEYDPCYYSNGNNYLTVGESVDRAFQRVYHEQLSCHSVRGIIDTSWKDDIKETIRKMIVNGDGRGEIYRIAGAIVRDFKNGYIKGIPFSVVFDAVVEGKMHVATKTTHS